MLEMSLHALRRAPSSQQPAREAPDRVEAEKPRSIQQKSENRNSGTLTGGLTVFSRSRCIASKTRRTRDIQQKTSTGRIWMHARGRPRSSARRERCGTQEVLLRTTTTLVVLKTSADHAVAENLKDRERRSPCSRV